MSMHKKNHLSHIDQSGSANMVDVSNTEAGNIYTLNSYGNFYEDLTYVGSESTIFDSEDISLSHYIPHLLHRSIGNILLLLSSFFSMKHLELFCLLLET